MEAGEFIENNYHINIQEYKGKLCSDKTFEPVTYEEVAEAYHKAKVDDLCDTCGDDYHNKTK